MKHKNNTDFPISASEQSVSPTKIRILNILSKVLIILIVTVLVAVLVLYKFVNDSMVSELEFTEISQQVQLQKDDTNETEPLDPSSTPVVSETPETPTVLPQYVSLYEENNEMVGWLTIPDTKVDYPVMHTPDDPEKYLHNGFDGNYSYPGVPFIDAACSADSDNLLIYGHNMNNGTMFRDITKYQQKNFWESHPTITFNTLYEEQEFEVLAAFYDRVYLKKETCFKFYQFIDAADEADYDNAIAQFRDKAIYDTGVEANYGDQLITLVTCSSYTDNGRFVVVAVKK